MSLRIPALLPRVAAIVLAALGATATLTYAAGRNIGDSTPAAASAPTVQTTVVVPDVRNQAFVFAKGSLEDAGLAWKVVGSVHGYSANTVLSQSPAAGTKLLDTGAPLITLTLKRNAQYSQVGQAEDASPYEATVAQPAELAVRPLPATTPPVTTPAATTPAATTPAATTTTPRVAAAPKAKAAAPVKKTAALPQSRPAAFVVPGARAEPLDEIPLTARATQLDAWLAKHPKSTNTNVKYWLYQHEWIVTGAKLGWWHGAEALKTLIAVDKHAELRWGFGAKSEAAATAALRYVEARSGK